MPLAGDGDELGDLARSFGKLFDEVGAYTDYLRTLASKLSHELNTPLAIVKSSLDNLDHQALPDEARAYADRARDGADRLGKIVRAMSEAGRIERAIAAADVEDFDLRALVAGCAESYRALAGSRRLDVHVPADAMPFHGAPELIAQALDKLFDNARSFAPPDGWIALALERDESGALIRVANSGPALPAAMQERLFDSLVSVRESVVRGGETPHLGLGLYVVRLVAELHRGFAEARNLADGRGVEFVLRLGGMPRRRLTEGAADV
jgi:signal transduction histidine kinase